MDPSNVSCAIIFSSESSEFLNMMGAAVHHEEEFVMMGGIWINSVKSVLVIETDLVLRCDLVSSGCL